MNSNGKEHSSQNGLHDCKVFLVDGDSVLALRVETELRSHGAEVMRTASLQQALVRFPAYPADVVLLDLALPDGDGLELLERWRRDCPHLPIIVIASHGTTEPAMAALRLGAFDYLQKPIDMHAMLASVKRAAEVSTLRRRVTQFEGQEHPRDSLSIIGHSVAISTLKDQVLRIARSKVDTVLILGESGSGKELVARAIHEWSEHPAGGPFVEINCASIPDTLLESELFGHERGAFTDAREKKLGLFEIAKKGTIFLDEIGEMPFKLQSKLLRALESRRFKHLGGVKDIAFSARVVAATNRNLLEEVRKGNFRADLYYRLGVLGVVVPPLRDHKDDIVDLSRFFLDSLSAQLATVTPKLSQEAVEHLKTHSWPGNVRELRNVLLRALVLHEPETLLPQHLTLELSPVESARPSNFVAAPIERAGAQSDNLEFVEHDSQPKPTFFFQLPEKGISLEDLERSLLEQALQRVRHNQTRAANLLGISRHTLRYRLEKHGLLTQDGL